MADSNSGTHNAVKFCLGQRNLTGKDLNHVVFFAKPFSKFDRILRTTLQGFPKTYPMFVQSMRTWLLDKLDGNNLDLTQQVNFPHSIGLLYSAFTAFLGFEHYILGIVGIVIYLPVFFHLVGECVHSPVPIIDFVQTQIAFLLVDQEGLLPYRNLCKTRDIALLKA